MSIVPPPDSAERSDGDQRTGRPRAAEPSRVAAIGLELFDEHGIDNVTMSQIARQAGVSRTTLLRYFPTKTDLLWNRLPDELETFKTALAHLGTAEDPAKVVCCAAATILSYGDEETDVLRMQVRIIASHERDADSLPPRMSSLREAIVEALSVHLGWERDGLDAQLLARTVTSAGWTALLVWARSDEQRPERLLSAALRRVEKGFAQ